MFIYLFCLKGLNFGGSCPFLDNWRHLFKWQAQRGEKERKEEMEEKKEREENEAVSTNLCHRKTLVLCTSVQCTVCTVYTAYGKISILL